MDWTSWGDVMGKCYQAKAAAMAACAAYMTEEHWSAWSDGNTGWKSWASTIGWNRHYIGGYWPYGVACVGDMSLADTQFRYLVPDLPAGTHLQSASVIETLSLDGVGDGGKQVDITPSAPGSYYTHTGSYTPGSNGTSEGWYDPPFPDITGSCYISSGQ